MNKNKVYIAGRKRGLRLSHVAWLIKAAGGKPSHGEAKKQQCQALYYFESLNLSEVRGCFPIKQTRRDISRELADQLVKEICDKFPITPYKGW